MYMCSYLDFQC